MTERKLTRKEAKERSRQRLISATIDLLRNRGPAGLTTGKIARAAGLSQPSFYVHFKDMEDALDAAANEIGKLIRRTLHEERERLRSQRSHDSLHAAFLAALNAFLAHPTFTEVLLRYRRDDVTPVGRYARSLVDGMRQDMLDDLRSMGLDESRMPCLSLYVELLMGMILAAVEGLLDRRFTNVSDCAEALLRSSISLYTALGEKPFGEKPFGEKPS